MTSNTVDIPMSDLTKQMTLELRLTGVKVFGVRLWFGKQLIRAASKVMGMEVKIEGLT